MTFFFSLGHIHLFWLWEVVPKEKGRFYIWIPVSGGQRLELKLNNKEKGVLTVHSTRRWIPWICCNCQSACMRVEEKWRDVWSLLSLSIVFFWWHFTDKPLPMDRVLTIVEELLNIAKFYMQGQYSKPMFCFAAHCDKNAKAGS